MLLNLSNHPSGKWNEKQLAEAGRYGEIIDLRFPEVDPHGDSDYIDDLVEAYISEIQKYNHPVVMVQGEYTFTYRLVRRLKEAGIKAIAGCSERRTIEYVDEDGFTARRSEFEFIQFREY